MKKLLYYVIMIAIFIVLDLIVCFGYAFANLKPGGILFYALLIMAFTLTGMASPYIKKLLGIVDEKEENKDN